jgi:hypothetical protein
MAMTPARGPAEGEIPEAVDELAESAFRAEARERGEAIVPIAARPAEMEEKGPLPPLDSLVQRIPADVRETLEELFRAKFVKVRHVPAKALKAK